MPPAEASGFLNGIGGIDFVFCSDFAWSESGVRCKFLGSVMARLFSPTSIPDPARFERASWVWPVMLAATVFFASGQSQVSGPGWINFDKIAHLAVFGLLGTLIARTQPPHRWWWGIGLASLYGAADELRQSFTPGRWMEFDDWLADTLGALLSVTLYVRWRVYHECLERKIMLRTAPSVATAETPLPNSAQ